MIHLLKLWPEPFEAIASGRKRADVRDCEERQFAVGDVLVFHRHDPNAAFEKIDTEELHRLYMDLQGKVGHLPGWLVCEVTHVGYMAGPLHLFGITLSDGHRLGRLARVAVLSFELQQ